MEKFDSVHDLRVEVSAILCRLRLPASILGALEAGDSLEIAASRNGEPAIEITAGGRLFARASLVERDGCRYAKIDSFITRSVRGAPRQWRLIKQNPAAK